MSIRQNRSMSRTIKKSGLLWAFTLLGFTACVLIFVGRAQAETIGFALSEKKLDPGIIADLDVTVLEDISEDPVRGATVTVTDSLDQSVATHETSSLTGDWGAAHFIGLAPGQKVVTVEKEGYVTFTLVGVQSPSMTVYLKPLLPTLKGSVGSGTLGGWQASTTSNVVQAGLVFRSLSAFDLLTFQVDSFISPLKDEIDVYGPRKIPSNLVLPEQDVFLPFGSITLDKPTYRLPITNDGKSIRLSGLHGEMKTSEIMNAVQNGGKFDIEVLNKLKFSRVGLTSTFVPNGNFKKDFDAALELVAKHKVTVNRPPFTADVLVASMTDLSGDRQTLMPTDVKLAINSEKPETVNSVTLVGPSQNLGQSRNVAAFAIGHKGRRLTGIVVDKAGSQLKTGEFLPVNELRDYSALPASIQVQAPARGLGAVVFESESKAATPGSTRAKSYPIWVVYTLPKAQAISIPTSRLAARNAQVSSYAVNQFEFGAGFSETELNGHTIMRKLERFTRASADKIVAQVEN